MHVSRLGRPVAALVAVVLGALLLAGCGDDAGDGTAQDPASGASSSDETSATPSDDPSSTSTPRDPGPTGDQVDWPACDAVWRAGDTLAGGYDGCLDAGKAVKPTRLPCSSGQKLYTYDDRFWATAGGTISEADGKIWNDPEYRRVEGICLG